MIQPPVPVDGGHPPSAKAHAARPRTIGAAGEPTSDVLSQAMVSCRDHLEPLYALGLLRTGADRPAMDAVVQAILEASADPEFASADPTRVWRLLASHVYGAEERGEIPDAASASPAIVPMSLKQEAVALVSVAFPT